MLTLEITATEETGHTAITHTAADKEETITETLNVSIPVVALTMAAKGVTAIRMEVTVAALADAQALAVPVRAEVAEPAPVVDLGEGIHPAEAVVTLEAEEATDKRNFILIIIIKT
jgi:hypothetical protein